MVVCVFEALCTHRGPLGIPGEDCVCYVVTHFTGFITCSGGATPGKLIMGLKIVRCTQVLPLGLNRVQVNPASDMGFGWALVRSVLKNFSLGIKIIHMSSLSYQHIQHFSFLCVFL